MTVLSIWKKKITLYFPVVPLKPFIKEFRNLRARKY